jgi:hypothetical protein
VPATKTPRTLGAIPLPRSLASSQATAHTATSIFAPCPSCMGCPMTRPSSHPRGSGAAVHPSGSMHRPRLFRIAVELDGAMLSRSTAACYAAERAAIDPDCCAPHALTGLRVLWFAAIRVSDALCSLVRWPRRVYATWTDDVSTSSSMAPR